MKRLNLIRLFYTALLGGIFILFFSSFSQEKWLETDLRTLLPTETSWSSIQIYADKRQETLLNQNIVALIGHQQPTTAYHLANEITKLWQESSQFSQINSKIQPDLLALQADIQRVKFAVLPESIRQILLTQPSNYFQVYAQQLANPFIKTNLLPLEQDWLGFGRFVLPQSQKLSHMQWDAENGFIYTENAGKTWVLLNGQLKQREMMNVSQDIPTLITQSKAIAQHSHADFISTGALLFSAHSKQQAEKESTWMSIIGIGLTLLLLLSVFRTLHILWLFLPIVLGMLVGSVFTILVLGKIHILTLVIGTSLVGVLIDFPLHWCASSIQSTNWHSEKAMQAHQSTFLITLSITLLGYGLLWFTDLPILKQTALFSATALIVALLTTRLFLPLLIKQPPLTARLPVLPFSKIRLKHPILYVITGLFIATGIYQSKWQDDIRQWINLPKAMLADAQKIGELTGIDLGSQYFLVTAKNDDDLLEKERVLSAQLTKLGQPHQALSQWIMSEKMQQAFYLQITDKIQPNDYRALDELGVPNEYILAAFDELKKIQPVSLKTALNTSLGQGWNALYLGNLNSQVASLVKIINAKDQVQMRALANGVDIFWQDKRAYLNDAFQQTRNKAAWLKILSFAIAGLFLWRCFGARKTIRLLCIPSIAIAGTIAMFGWLGFPITLFAMFGLLLVSAIGIDYVAYMQSIQEQKSTKHIAITLAATTTLISFGLLAFSSTPAVSSFGLSVTIGVFFAALLSLSLD
ncbi:MMPL family transporter [Haemophilus haemolyticus]|uniref:MMPL family transporter n=1 Tax=Haemophilus haemolyticus TaxID=726 RepID=UPI000E570851|nr:hypothetical protein [Haemophilus haemolyticus]